MFRSIPVSSQVFKVAAIAVMALAGAVQAADWPKAKPIRIIVPNPPAGPSDIAIRPLAAAAQAALGQAVVVENKPGANGNIGAAEVARAAPDGYTWFWTIDPVLTVNPHIYKSTILHTIFSKPICSSDEGHYYDKYDNKGKYVFIFFHV